MSSTDPVGAGGAPDRVRAIPSRWPWLLSTLSLTAFVAAVFGVLVAPGLRGLASDRVVTRMNFVALTFANFLCGALVVGIVVAALELSKKSTPSFRLSSTQVSLAGLIVAAATPALLIPLHPFVSAVLAVLTSVAVITGGLRGLRANHTRAVAAVVLAFGVAGLLRVGAWELARQAGDAASKREYELAQGVATLALVLEALGQMMAAAWLGTRSRFAGQALSSVAVGVAFLLTASANHGASVTASRWEAGTHIALATASTLPAPFLVSGLAVFLLAGSILLAGVAAAQRGQVVAVTSALGLSLVARGEFDVPIHALAATAGAMWLTVAVTDERAVWQSLLASRGARGGRSSGAPSPTVPPSSAPSGNVPRAS